MNININPLQYLQMYWYIDIDLLTLIRMAGGVYDSRNFEEIQLKMAWIKNIFNPKSIPHKVY